MTGLTDNEIKALSYHAIGVSSEGGDVAYQLSLAGKTEKAANGSVTLRPAGNSGYTIGTLQIDFGQTATSAHDLVSHFQSWTKSNHPDWMLDDQKQKRFTDDLSRDGHHIRDANYDADRAQFGKKIPADRYPAAGPDIDQTFKSHLNTYLATDDGKNFVHQQDVAQVDRLTSKIGTPLRNTSMYKNASPEDQARIYVAIAKAYNQNETLGLATLHDVRDGRIDSLAAINSKIDNFSEYTRTGREHALQGVDQFIALRNSSATNSMHALWQAVVADPLVNPTKLGQDPKQPHLPEQYDIVRGSFVDPVQGRAFVEALEAHGSRNHGDPASPKSRGFYAEGQDMVQWDHDGRGRALIGGQWTEFRREDLALKRNPDHTADLDLTRNGQTETLLHVTHPTGSRAEASPRTTTAQLPGQRPQPDSAAPPAQDAQDLWRAVAARAAPPTGPIAAATVTPQREQALTVRPRQGL